MEGLETVGVREAALWLDDAGAALLSGVVAEMDAAVAAGDYERWATLNSDLHRTINEIARMPLLREMTERVLSRWERLRRHYFDGVVVPRVAQAQEEHHALLDALVRRDPDGAEQVVRAHNQAAQTAYAEYLRRDLPPAKRPDPRVLAPFCPVLTFLVHLDSFHTSYMGLDVDKFALLCSPGLSNPLMRTNDQADEPAFGPPTGTREGEAAGIGKE